MARRSGNWRNGASGSGRRFTGVTSSSGNIWRKIAEGCWGASGLYGQRGVVNRGGPAPGVQARQRAEVGPSGVEADRGVGEPARGRRGDGQRPHCVGASGEGGRFGWCSLIVNGNYRS